MKNALLFSILLLCGIYLQAQTETAQQKINQLVGTWSFVALSDGTDSLVIGSPEIPFAEQLFVVWQEASDIGEDSINAKILTDGEVGNKGKGFIYYGSNFGSTGWKIDFPNEELPHLFIVNDTMLIFNIVGTYNFYFTRVVNTCADFPIPFINGNSILYPTDTSVLSIANIYSSYQWYKRPYFPLGSTPQPIAGATSATYTVHGNTDALYYFSVAVTLDTCELISNELVIDQTITVLPYIEKIGNIVLCKDSVLLLIMHNMLNPQWYKDGIAIPNETNDTLIVMTAGSYTALGLDTDITVMEANTPVPIIDGGNTDAEIIFPIVINSQYYEHFEWFEGIWLGDIHLIIGVDSASLTNETCLTCLVNDGSYYKVIATDQYGCSEDSGVRYITWYGIEEIYGSKIRVYPNPATNFVQIENSGSQQIKALNIIDATGRVVLSQTPLSNNHSPTLLVQNLAVGMYYCQIVLSNGILYRPFAKF